MPRKKKTGKRLAVRADGRCCAWYQGKCFYGSTQDEAEAKRDAYKRLAQSGKLPDRTVLRLYAGKWLKIAKPDVSERTRKQYDAILRRLLTDIGDKKIAEVLPSDILSVMAGLSRLSHSYVHKAEMIYRELFQAAVRDRIISINPLEGLSMPKGTTGTHRTIEPWERELILTTNHRCKLAALLMLYEGLRRGEALATRAKDILIDDNILLVHQSVYYIGNAPLTRACKNVFSYREIPIFEPVHDILESFVAVAEPDQLVLPAADGVSMCSETAFQRAWASYMTALSEKHNGDEQRWYGRRAGDTRNRSDWEPVDIRCHDLRHTFVSDARDAGVEINVLRRWVGHSSERMILQVYDHVRPEREQAEADILNARFRAQKCSQNQSKTSQAKTDSPQTLTNQASQTPAGLTTNQKVVGSNPAGLTAKSLEK